MTGRKRNLWIATAGVALLAIIVVIGLQPREADVAPPSGSPTASSSRTPAVSPTAVGSIGSTASPSAASTPTGAYNDDFGFVLTEPGAGRTTTIRRESGTRLGSFDQEQFAVSPDGRQIAWFTPFGAQPQQLRIASAADVTQSRVLRTIAANERGGTIVWSNDASGLLYVVATTDNPPSGGVETAALYTVHTFDLRGATDRAVLTSPTRGLVFQPYAWDRAADVAAVGETGGGGFLASYDLIRFNGSEAVTTKTAPPFAQMTAFSVSASSDAKFMLGATFANGGSLLWWPLADFGAGKPITGAQRGFWRPQTHEVATVGACAGDPACGPNGGVRLVDVDKGTSRIVYGFGTANMNVRTFRADGSALIVFAPQPPGANQYDYTLVSLSGASPVTFKEVNGLIASVRLR